MVTINLLQQTVQGSYNSLERVFACLLARDTNKTTRADCPVLFEIVLYRIIILL